MIVVSKYLATSLKLAHRVRAISLNFASCCLKGKQCLLCDLFTLECCFISQLQVLVTILATFRVARSDLFINKGV